MFRPATQFIQAAEPRPSSPLDKIILPAARQRWMFGLVQSYTPDTIETTLRSALSGDLQAAWRLYDLMEATWPRLSKNLKELKDAVVSADWSIQPWTQRGKPPTPEATRRAEVLDAAIWSMSALPTREELDFRGLLFDLLDAWGKGISVAEILWEQRSVQTFGRVITPRAATHVWPLYYGYPADGNELMLNIAAVRMDNPTAAPAPAQWVPFTPDKFLVGIAKQKSGHPAGSSLLRPLAWWWCAANFSASWFLNFAQIFGVPIRWANYDTSVPGVFEQVCSMMEALGHSGWGVFPPGTTLELKEASKGAAGSLPQEAVIDRADRNCDILVLGQTLTTDVGDSGSRALGDVHQNVLGGRKRAAADWLAGVLTSQLASAFCRLNWGNNDDCPQFVVGSEAAEDPLVMAQRDEILLRAGIRLPQEWFYGRHDIPIPGDGEPVIEAPAQPSLQPPGQYGQPPQMPQDKPGKTGGYDDAPTQASAVLQAHPGILQCRLTQEGVDAPPDLASVLTRSISQVAGVRTRWLAPVASAIDRVAAAARDKTVPDAEVLRLTSELQRQLPDIFDGLDQADLVSSIESALGAAAIEGATTTVGARKP